MQLKNITHQMLHSRDMLEDMLQNEQVKKGRSGAWRAGTRWRRSRSPRMQAEGHLDGSRRPWRQDSRKSVTQQILDVFEYFKRSVEFGDNK